jgi:hypothetical protein
MTYNSILYLCVFLPLVLLFYQLIPQRHRWKILLLSSYIFFYSLSGKLLVYLLISTFLIYYIGLWLSNCEKDFLAKQHTTDDRKALKSIYARNRRRILWLGIGLQLGILLVLK